MGFLRIIASYLALVLGVPLDPLATAAAME